MRVAKWYCKLDFFSLKSDLLTVILKWNAKNLNSIKLDNWHNDSWHPNIFFIHTQLPILISIKSHIMMRFHIKKLFCPFAPEWHKARISATTCRWSWRDASIHLDRIFFQTSILGIWCSRYYMLYVDIKQQCQQRKGSV